MDKLTLSTAIGVNYSWIDYRLLGDDSTILTALNDAVDTLGEERTSVKLDLGAAYRFAEKWQVTSQLSVGNFVNLNVGTAYTILD
jgi:hypothetical protein